MIDERRELHALDEYEKREIVGSLAYAIRQIKDDPVFNAGKHLVVQEFWHSLNRKRLVFNGEVESLIKRTLFCL